MQYSIFWHRRDLRIHDNAGLYKALKSAFPIQPIFIFDQNILKELPKGDKRVQFIYGYIQKLKNEYAKYGADLMVYYSTPQKVFKQLAESGNVSAVYSNRDYEPYALERDKQVFELLKNHNIDFIGAKDHVIFEKDEVIKDDGKPYTVFTPYSRKWKAKIDDFHLKTYPVEDFLNTLKKCPPTMIPTLNEMGFEEILNIDFPEKTVSQTIISNYHKSRDLPGIHGTSRLSVHLRFGTISIRELAKQATTNETFLNELIWRDFYHMILFHFPHSVDKAFKPKYDFVEWENNESHFKAWCEGRTGYPLVDAGMRELNKTGFMHNRVRMVVASFLTKHLLIDWRWGERYFAEKLLDFDLAANVGGWQWAASSGCDASPYFRVFNPTAQMAKFDPKLIYVKKWVPEYGTSMYPEPIVEHKFARKWVLERYKKALLN